MAASLDGISQNLWPVFPTQVSFEEAEQRLRNVPPDRLIP